jgi:hypothetical protein
MSRSARTLSATAALQIRTRSSPRRSRRRLVARFGRSTRAWRRASLITMREQVDRTTAGATIAVTILVLFGALALVLAAVGLYGVMASTVPRARASSR